MTKMKPVNVKVWHRATTLVAENVRSPNSVNGSMGELVVFSLQKKIRVSGKTQLFTPKTFQPVEKVQENSSDSYYSHRSELDE